MLYKKLKRKKGFSLLEVLIAIFVIVVGIVASMALVAHTIRLSSFSTSRLIAAYLAQEGMEIVRNVRDTNWLQIRQGSSDSWDYGLSNHCSDSGFVVDYTYTSQPDPDFPCFNGQFLKLDSNGFYNYSSGNNTIFQRKVSVSKLDSDTLNVVVDVFWREHGKDYSFSLQENLYNWLR